MNSRIAFVMSVAILLLVSGCERSGELTAKDREVLIETADVDDLKDYCDILEILYAEPATDPRVIEKMEKLVFKNIYPFVIAEVDIDELGVEQIDAIEAFLRLSENEAFARTQHPGYFGMYIEYLSGLEAEFDARREWLRKNTRIIL